MNHQMLLTDIGVEREARCNTLNMRKFPAHGTSNQVVVKTDNVWMETDRERWSLVACNGVEAIEELIGRVRKDLANMRLPTNVRQRFETMADLVQLLSEDQVIGPLSTRHALESVDIVSLIQRIIERKKDQLAPSDRVHGITLRYYPSRSGYRLLVQANSQWLSRALYELIDNAIEAMVDSPTKELTLFTEFRDNGASIRVKDTGTGIPVTIQPLLLKERIRKTQGRTGTGLLLARCIFLTYGGKLQVESTSSEGTIMSGWLPLEWLRSAKD